MAGAADFLQAIRTDPDDDTVRLVYADWLDDRGEGDRAEFIRVQVKLAGECSGPDPYCLNCYGGGGVPDTRTRPPRKTWCTFCHQGLRGRSIALREAVTGAILKGALEISGHATSLWFDFARGFITRMTCRSLAWVDLAGWLMSRELVFDVELTDCCEPHRTRKGQWMWWWLNPSAGPQERDGDEVPSPLYQRVSGRFSSKAMALDALRIESLRYGREQAEQLPATA
jgi:uncharacterized protein (TIGR02996 family)